MPESMIRIDVQYSNNGEQHEFKHAEANGIENDGLKGLCRSIVAMKDIVNAKLSSLITETTGNTDGSQDINCSECNVDGSELSGRQLQLLSSRTEYPDIQFNFFEALCTKYPHTGIRLAI